MVNEKSILEQYANVFRRLLLLPPALIERRLDGETDGKHQKPVIMKVLYALVCVLAVASVVNISHRAQSYHAGLFSYVYGAGLALVVPATVFIAAHFKGLQKSSRGYAWAVAVVAALVSMLIQIKVYMAGSSIMFDELLSGNVDLEALAFSVGIPFFEVLLASLSAIVSTAHERNLSAIHDQEVRNEQLRKDIEKREADERRKQFLIEQEQEMELEAKRREIERRDREADQAIRLAEQEKLAQIEARKQAAIIDAESKAEARVAKAKQGSKTVASNDRESFQETVSETIEKQIVRYVKANPAPLIEDIAKHVGVTKGTVSKKIGPLIDDGVLHSEQQGRRRILTVNGTHEAFLAS